MTSGKLTVNLVQATSSPVMRAMVDEMASRQEKNALAEEPIYALTDLGRMSLDPDNGFGRLKQSRPSREKGRTHKKRDAPCKVCPSCYSVLHTGVRVCHECGHEFFAKQSRPSLWQGVKNEDRKA